VDVVIPLPVVRTAARRSWNQIYRDAERGCLGPVSRIGSRLYVRSSLAREYVKATEPQNGLATLERLLQPTDVLELRP
jgi:hypothetical protein